MKTNCSKRYSLLAKNIVDCYTSKEDITMIRLLHKQ